MKRLASLWVCLSVVAVMMPLHSAKRILPIDVVRPTIVAFFPPVTEAELSKDWDTEALADFQVYAERVRKPLKQRHIDFHEVYAHSFAIRRGKTATTFKPLKVNVGYYFVAPGKKPRVEYGVTTDDDLLQIADEYFGTKKK